MTQAPGRDVSFLDVLEQWKLLKFSFQSVLHIDLEEVWHVKSWRWFTDCVHGLLSNDTPLSRHFKPDDEPQPPNNVMGFD